MAETYRLKVRGAFGQAFAALRHYNYRLWFLGQLTSLIGTWMQNTAQGYLVFELTRSTVYLGYVAFAAGLPAWLFSLYGGVIADRISRRNLLVITQSMMMILAFILAGLVFTHLVQPWQIVVLAFLLGIANAFDAPARQAFVAELVEREDMTNAIALNSTMFNAAIVVGPAVAGLTYAALGAQWCFTLNGLSFIAVIVALLSMRVKPVIRQIVHDSAIAEIREGFRYAIANPVILTLTINIGVIALFGISMMTLLPAWSVNVLGGDVTTNGLLLSARGIGALSGALMIAWLGSRRMRGKIWTIGSLSMPVMMFIFALIHWLPLSFVFLMLIGWSYMVMVNTSNAMVQMRLPDGLRGRVMGIYTFVFFGALPLGSLLVGELANRLSEPGTVMISATIMAVFALYVWLRLPFLRRLE